MTAAMWQSGGPGNTDISGMSLHLWPHLLQSLASLELLELRFLYVQSMKKRDESALKEELEVKYLWLAL